MRKERVGFAMCGSFCTHAKVLAALGELVKEYETVIPIVSEMSRGRMSLGYVGKEAHEKGTEHA